MKSKDLKILRDKKIDELEKIVGDKKNDFAKAKVDQKASKEKNLKKAKNLKQEISRILTIIREKEIIEEEKGKI